MDNLQGQNFPPVSVAPSAAQALGESNNLPEGNVNVPSAQGQPESATSNSGLPDLSNLPQERLSSQSDFNDAYLEMKKLEESINAEKSREDGNIDWDMIGQKRQNISELQRNIDNGLSQADAKEKAQLFEKIPGLKDHEAALDKAAKANPKASYLFLAKAVAPQLFVDQAAIANQASSSRQMPASNHVAQTPMATRDPKDWSNDELLSHLQAEQAAGTLGF